MEFRTKREARRRVHDLEQQAAREERIARSYSNTPGNENDEALCLKEASDRRAEAARIRALLPTLPE